MQTPLQEKQPIRQEFPAFATPAEAAKFLRLSKAMIHKLISVGTMPACRYGRAVRIPWSWLKTQAGEQT